MKALPPAWTTACGCWERSAEPPCRGTGPCGPSSTGVTVCSARTSNGSSVLSAYSPAALPARRPRPLPWMRQHQALMRSTAWPIWWRNRWSSRMSAAPSRGSGCSTRPAPTRSRSLTRAASAKRIARRHAEYYRDLFERAEAGSVGATAGWMVGRLAARKSTTFARRSTGPFRRPVTRPSARNSLPPMCRCG